MMTPKGLERGVGLHQLPEKDKWDMAFLKHCRGLPWIARLEVREAPQRFAGEGDEVAPAPLGVPVAADKNREEDSTF